MSVNTPTQPVVNAFSVDVEDYFHVEALASRYRPVAVGPARVPRRGEHPAPARSCWTTKACKATFFVLGWVAKRSPGLVREIHARGPRGRLSRPDPPARLWPDARSVRAGDARGQGDARGRHRRRRPRLSCGDLFHHQRVAVGARDPRAISASSTTPASFRCATTSTEFRTRHDSRIGRAPGRLLEVPITTVEIAGPAAALRRWRLLPPAALRAVQRRPASGEPTRRAAGGLLLPPVGGRPGPAARQDRAGSPRSVTTRI